MKITDAVVILNRLINLVFFWLRASGEWYLELWVRRIRFNVTENDAHRGQGLLGVCLCE